MIYYRFGFVWGRQWVRDRMKVRVDRYRQKRSKGQPNQNTWKAVAAKSGLQHFMVVSPNITWWKPEFFQGVFATLFRDTRFSVQQEPVPVKRVVSTIHQRILLCPFPSVLVHCNDLHNTLYRQCSYFFFYPSFCLYLCEYNSCFWRSYLQYLVAAVCSHLFLTKVYAPPVLLSLSTPLSVFYYIFSLYKLWCYSFTYIQFNKSSRNWSFSLSFKLTASEVVILLHYIRKT